jgi:hypothetical protein
LTRSVDKAETMIHRLKPTMSELLGTIQFLTSLPILNYPP